MRNEPLNQTANYQLNQWETTDRILMADFNSDNSKIDAALKAHSDAIAAEAEAREAAIDELAADRPCQFYTSSYEGEGAKSRTLSFPKKPVFVVVIDSASCFFTAYGAKYVCAIKSSGRDNQMLNCTWSGYSFTWTGDNDLYLDFPLHNYFVFALLDADT